MRAAAVRTGLALVAMTAGACSILPAGGSPESAPPSSPIAFPQFAPMEAYPAALIDGVLANSEGCLELRHAMGERWTVLWPQTAALAYDAGDPVVIENGAVVGRIGQPITLGGGEFTDDAFGGAGRATEWALSLTGNSLPERCLTGSYWLAASIHDR